MYVFGIELSNGLWRHVTCQGQRLLWSSWSPAVPADMLAVKYVPDMLDFFPNITGDILAHVSHFLFVSFPWLKLHPQPFSLQMRAEFNCSKC